MNNKVKFLRGTSGEYTVAEKDSDTIYFTTDDGKLYIGDKEISGDGSGGSYELPIATTEILGGVMPDGTTINVDENGVISTVGGHVGGYTVDTLLDITFNGNNDSIPYGGKAIILSQNITDYKFLYCTHAYVKSASHDKNTSVDDGLLNKSLIPTATLEWDYWETNTIYGYGTLLYGIEVFKEYPESPVEVYIKSENELYFYPISSNIYPNHRFLMIGIK